MPALYSIHTLDKPVQWFAGWKGDEPVWTNKAANALAMDDLETWVERSLLRRETSDPLATRQVGTLRL